MREITRREALTGAVSLGAVSVAGCVSDNSEPEEEEENGAENGTDEEDLEGQGSANGEAEGRPDVELVGSSVETTDTGCLSGTGGSASATTDGGALVVKGVVPTSDPCHEASLVESGTALDDGVLSVAIGADKAETDGCATCLGEVAYEATLEFSSDIDDISTFESVIVGHRVRNGETHVVAGSEAETDGGEQGSEGPGTDESDAGTAVNSHSIETVDTGCAGAVEDRVTGSDIARDNTVTVEGVVTASNPCHDATIEEASVRDGVLNIAVGATGTDVEMCVECVGEITYEATVELAESVDIKEVSVSSRTSVASE